MLHKTWNSKGEMPFCFPRSSAKFQGHTGQNITDFDPNWAFPDYRPVAAFKSLRFALLLYKMLRCVQICSLFSSLWSSDAIWRHRFGSTLADELIMRQWADKYFWPFVRGIHRSKVNSTHKGLVTRSFYVFFDLHQNKRLNKQWWGWWF